MISVKKRQRRMLHFVQLTEPHTYSVVDDGPFVSPGEQRVVDSSSRDRIRDMLAKRYTLPSGERVAFWCLAEPPTETFGDYGPDPFDDEVLRDRRTGQWATPSPEWLAQRAPFLKAYADKIERRRTKQREKASNKVASQLSTIVLKATQGASA
jgi:hypothetical protein